jgi:peroxiredoxin
MKISTFRFTIALGMLSLGAVMAGAAEQKTVRATIQAPADRKPAPAFRLLNASGKAMANSDYRGKILLLDFWATECGGCRVEIPWFVDLEKAHRNKGFTVVGVSVDIMYENLKDASEAWTRVKPFVQSHKVNYPILMGEDRVTKAYDLQALPATYLIDRSGRIAATYIGLVDKSDLEGNILTLLREQ